MVLPVTLATNTESNIRTKQENRTEMTGKKDYLFQERIFNGSYMIHSFH